MAVNKNFVIKNGLEVDNNLIIANASTNQVGIATSSPRFTFDVNGGFGAINARITGITTVRNIEITGTLTPTNAGAGVTGRVLVSTSIGTTWRSPRYSTVFTATTGQTTFSVVYTVGLVDVYVNGVKLIPPASSFVSNSTGSFEFTASNGSTVVLSDACFGGELVEIVSYSSI